MSVVYVGLGGYDTDVTAAVCSWGPVVSVTIRVQRGQHFHRQVTGEEAQGLL